MLRVKQQPKVRWRNWIAHLSTEQEVGRSSRPWIDIFCHFLLFFVLMSAKYPDFAHAYSLAGEDPLSTARLPIILFGFNILPAK